MASTSARSYLQPAQVFFGLLCLLGISGEFCRNASAADNAYKTQLKSGYTGYCLDASDGQYGTQLTMTACDPAGNRPSQQWERIQTEQGYKYQNAASSLCLSDSKETNGVPYIGTCEFSSNGTGTLEDYKMFWRDILIVVNNTSGVAIKSRKTDLCLDAAKPIGQRVTSVTCPTGPDWAGKAPNLQWLIRSTP